ncbi:aminoglycoside phosphotransferase family protein [Actinoplanes sp. NPDC051633]|uniref:phosphotransferase family protein n=1 Tax=Actinoplanes sp. NPDC051633 TaxID=3155670 RepID=UPI00342329A4
MTGLAEILAAIGRRPEELTPLAGGVANHAYLLGADLVLRVPRSESFAADLRKEAAVIPIVRAAGVKTADLVEYAEQPAPYLITTRLPGTETDAPAADQVGRELAKLHTVTAAPPEVPRDDLTDPHATVDGLARDGWIGAADATWLGEWFTRLAARVPAAPPTVLVHGDVAPQNLLSTPDGYLTGLIDWGDAALADPAVDFAKLPFASVPAALAGYREAGAPPGDWEPRILWHRLLWALGRTRDPRPQPSARHWSAPPAARLLDLLHFFTTDPPPPWPSLPPPNW